MGEQQLAYRGWHEQARRITDWRRERWWEVIDLKDAHQQETGKAASSHSLDVDGTGSGSLLNST